MSSPSARSRLGSTSETSSWASSTVSNPALAVLCKGRASAPCSAGEGHLDTGGLLDEPEGSPRIASDGVAVGGAPTQLGFTQEVSQNP